MKTASEMTYTVSSGALNSTPTNQSLISCDLRIDLPQRMAALCAIMCLCVYVLRPARIICTAIEADKNQCFRSPGGRAEANVAAATPDVISPKLLVECCSCSSWSVNSYLLQRRLRQQPTTGKGARVVNITHWRLS